jgi:hypothetical protein
VRLKIRAGPASIACRPGFASGTYPDWKTLKPMV